MSLDKTSDKEDPECLSSCPGTSTYKTASSTFYNSTLNRNVTILPVIPDIPGLYRPMPYTFRVPFPSNQILNSLIKCPPFCLQLDHTIAVIWSLFTKNDVPKELGIVQLQWASSFLRNVHNVKGDYTKDVQICIETIEEELIKLYAEMVDEVKSGSQKRTKSKACCSCFCKKKPSSTNNNITCKDHPSMSTTIYEQRQMPFSINYIDIKKKHSDHKITENKFESTTEEVLSQIDRNKMDTYELTEYLDTWRQKQINKLEMELQRLHSIEDLIAKSNPPQFKRYLDVPSIRALRKAISKKLDSLRRNE